jgi:hypothetical protein
MSRWLEKKSNQNKLYCLINNQPNIKWWNWIKYNQEIGIFLGSNNKKLAPKPTINPKLKIILGSYLPFQASLWENNT